MKRGRKMEDNGIQLSGGMTIGDFGDWTYKYLRAVNSDKIKKEEIKLKQGKITIKNQKKFKIKLKLSKHC